jgi:diguanylate cyclase (GGDEF)-like protein
MSVSVQPHGELPSSPLGARLHLLLLEDVPEDVELILLTLESADFKFTYDVADTESRFQEQLNSGSYDVILSDYRLPSFTGLQAFELLKQSGQDTPFILITGSLGEEAAVECLKAGISDYVLKDRLFRLPMVLKRALQDCEIRQQKQAALAQLQEQAWRDGIINQIVQQMRDTLVLKQVLQITVDQLRNALAVSGCFIAQPHAPDQPQISASEQFTTHIPSVVASLFTCPCYPDYHRLLEQRQLVVVPHVHQTLALNGNYAPTCEFQAMLLAPLHYQQAYLGLIGLVQCERDREWTNSELTLVKAIADYCAIAIHQADLYQKVQTELAERKRLEAQLRHDAFHDALTGLPNRALFVDRLQHSLRLGLRRLTRGSAEVFSPQFAVLFLDLDRFKRVNDSLGHAIGDQLLQMVAQRLTQCIRAGDTVARLGGDEFVILLEDVADINDVIEVAKRIQQILKTPVLLDKHEIFVSFSIGIALNSPSYTQPAQLLRDADTAMYRAKSRGRGEYEIFDTSMYTQACQQLQLENDLQRAIERGEFQPHYQPIVSLTTHHPIGFEVLLRWHHPTNGLMMPESFIPLAEDIGLIATIDLWVLRQACQQLRQWQLEWPTLNELTISVNLSGHQFSQPDLIAQIDQILHETNLDGQALKLEITESVLIKNAESAAVILQELRARKIQVCIDDFGTGYSSLSYLHRFPIDSLKIDRSFIARLDSSLGDQEIVKAIINLGITLGLSVVAEGIESIEQVQHLKNLGCHHGQGYCFSYPLDAESLARQLPMYQQSIVQAQLR